MKINYFAGTLLIWSQTNKSFFFCVGICSLRRNFNTGFMLYLTI